LCIPPPGKVAILVGRRIKYVDRPGYVQEKRPKSPRSGKAKRASSGYDARYLAGARELRDRYLEHVNTRQLECEGKYDVSRAVGVGKAATAAISSDARRSLPAPVAPAA